MVLGFSKNGSGLFTTMRIRKGSLLIMRQQGYSWTNSPSSIIITLCSKKYIYKLKNSLVHYVRNYISMHKPPHCILRTLNNKVSWQVADSCNKMKLSNISKATFFYLMFIQYSNSLTLKYHYARTSFSPMTVMISFH